MTTREAVITKILDCGTNDLALLDDINYNLDDIIENLMRDNILSLHTIIEEVFFKAADDLKEILEAQKEEIKEQILIAIEDEKEWITSGEMTQEELEECEEHKELINDLMLIESGELNPVEDLDYYLNCLDTHVHMKNIGFYRKWMENELEEIENNMGWSFKEVC